jgi:hypothetical protein
VISNLTRGNVLGGVMPVILTTWEVETGRSQFKDSPREKFTRTHVKQWLGMVVSTCHPSYVGKHNTRIMVQAGLDMRRDPISK